MMESVVGVTPSITDVARGLRDIMCWRFHQRIYAMMTLDLLPGLTGNCNATAFRAFSRIKVETKF